MRARHLSFTFLALALAAACSGDDDESAPTTAAATTVATTAAPETTAAPTTLAEGELRATIRRTEDGVPHITGPDVASVQFGQGYASAEDRACDLADMVLTVKGQKSQFLGAGDNDRWINSDLAWRAIDIVTVARRDFETAAPDEVVQQFEAFAAGWNTYLEEVGAQGVPGWCRNQPWVQPLEPWEIYTYARSIALNASSSRLVSYIATAQPPAVGGITDEDDAAEALASLGEPPAASNAWAFGKDVTAGGGGMLVGNPHFPWIGHLRFWETHLVVPGELNVYGAQLSGLPGIGIGFTEEFAWSHTVSAGNRFTVYQLQLVPGSPTTYQYDGGTKEMTKRKVDLLVLQPDGSTQPVQRDMWSSHYGPVINFPGVGWTEDTVLTYRDANLANDEFVEQYVAMDRAASFDEFVAAHEEHQAVPLFNTVATSRDGRAWYADTSATPALSPEAQAAYDASLATNPLAGIAAQNGVILLDGSDPQFEWVDEPGARDPGLVPYDQMPQVERTDYVFNANDSFWLPHADEVLEGDYSILHGRQRTARSPRTRENATVLQDATAAGGLTIDDIKDLALANRGYTSRALKDELVARCQATPSIDVPADDPLPAATVDLTKACEVLAAWDGTYELDSRGAHVWREFTTRFATADGFQAGNLWAEPFDPARPVDTPSGLAPAPATGPDPILVKLGRAVQIVEKAGFALDAPLGDLQVANRNGTLVPIHGGTNSDGTTNIVGYGGFAETSEPRITRGPTMAPRSALTADGYLIDNGTSFLMAVALGPDGPDAWTFLTYGNSGDPSSDVFVEATERFSRKDWKQARFTEEQVVAGTDSTKEVSATLD
jgi:acyl-homoserine-lactone acylase